MRAVVAVFCLWFYAATALSADIFVDNAGGDDRFDGSASKPTIATAGPVRTIAKALRVAGPGDRIMLTKNAEPYRESVTFFGPNNSGYSEDRPFILQGNGATLDGAADVPANAWQFYSGYVFRFTPRWLHDPMLFLDGRPAGRVFFNAASGKLPDIQDKEWFQAGTQIYFRVEQGRLPADYKLSYADKTVGITLYRVQHVAIVDLVVQRFAIDGISAPDNATDVFLSGLTCRGNGRSGIAVSGSSQVQIDASLVGDNNRAQLWLEGQSTTRLTNNDILDNTAPRWKRDGGRLWIDGKLTDAAK